MFWSKDTSDSVCEKRALLRPFNLSETIENHLIERMHERHFSQGDVVVREGEDSHSIYIIATGNMIVLKSNEDGKEVEIATMRHGDFFGEMSFLRNKPRSSTVIAKEDSRLFEIAKKRSVDFLISSNPELEKELEMAILRRRKNDAVKLGKLE